VTDVLLDVLELSGVFTFALTGALVGVRKALDVLGILVLALVTGLGGGIVRDLLIGHVPPNALEDWHLPATATAAAVVVYFLHGPVQRLGRSILLLDSIGLSVFCVSGTVAAAHAGLSVGAATALGAVTAVGGGVIRDGLTAEVPLIFRGELYALPALLGALVSAVVERTDGPAPLYLLAAALCLIWRLLAVRRGWSAPSAWRRRAW
jgi:uncharacterized membrane protein YeiH